MELNEFQDVLIKFSQKEVKYYIGLGNPNAKILIIGKECAPRSKAVPQPNKNVLITIING